MGLMISPMWCTSPSPTCLLVILQMMPVADCRHKGTTTWWCLVLDGWVERRKMMCLAG